MKRAGFLISEITDLSNLYLAFYKSSKSKHTKPEVIAYKKKLYENLLQLQNQINTGNIE